ncbi:MAG: glutamate--tRNA ligase [Candidatus Aminicenantes bacterium]|nr:MAG: glutamate--tRNA ligase [Candidatus Aminicenantes bacterium]
MNITAPIVRFAPSPTGHLHIGGVRTALFNYLFARNQAGQFILRIEDTDISRSSKEMAGEIFQGLEWLGIQWDKGPIYQSHHFARYKEIALRLLEENKAYRCFCTPGEIEARRKASGKKNKSEQIYKYDRQCLHLTPGQIKEKLEHDIPFVIRFAVPDGATYFKDRLHKEMKVENDQLEDFVILKSDNSPTYHLSVVVDDSDMEITDVIRGDDHISNTFKQVLLFRALGRKPPKYTHLPLILGPDRKKLSKRHGETSVLEFKQNGYLPEAVITYLSQLSWLPADSKKIFSMQELVNQFKLSSVSKNSPVFDYDKLRFLNSRALQQSPPQDLLHLLEENETSDFNKKFSAFAVEKKLALIELVKPRMKTLDQFEQKFNIYLKGELNYNNPDLQKLNETYSNEQIKKYLQLFLDYIQTIDPNGFNNSALEQGLRECADKNGLKAADLIHPTRFALTSEMVSPSIFDVLAFLGKEESIKRMNRLIDYLGKLND